MRTPGDRLQVRLLSHSLIEVVTAIAIISILASLLVTAVGTVKETARRTHAQSDLAQLVAAVTGFEISTAPDVTDHQKIEQGPQVALEQHPFERIR